MSWPFMIVTAILVLTFVLRMPIALGMMAAAIFYLLSTGADLGVMAENVLTNLFSNYVIIAVPLFVFTANIMNNSTVTDKVYKFAHSMVGGVRGALGHVNVIGSLIFSGMTGSAIADASGLGVLEINAMKKAGYEAGFSCALSAASAVIGPIFPPSIPMVFYAMLSGASIGALFMGGMVPGILIAIALMIYVYFISKKRNYPKGEKITFRDFIADTIVAFPALLTPAILLGGIYSGVMTPTEAGAVAAFYSLLIAFFIYRSLGWKELKIILVDTVKTIGILSIMVGAAYSFSYVVSVEHIPDAVANFALGLTTNKYLMLFIINILFLILGCFMDTTTITLVFIPIVLPTISALGIDLVHFGVVIVLNMMIGLMTPPFGMLLFVTSGCSGTPLKDIIRESFPMTACLIAVLFILTYVPDLILFIPRLVLKH